MKPKPDFEMLYLYLNGLCCVLDILLWLRAATQSQEKKQSGHIDAIPSTVVRNTSPTSENSFITFKNTLLAFEKTSVMLWNTCPAYFEAMVGINC